MDGPRDHSARKARGRRNGSRLGIGRAISLRLADGAAVAILDLNEPDAQGAAAVPEKMKEKALDVHLTRRFGSPEDIAAAVAFLVDTRLGFNTAEHLTIDGGWSAKMPHFLDGWNLLQLS
jgi:NAD(P)-dependent dehydrogenase (short-subunit alcohol dehydrogenase family)